MGINMIELKSEKQYNKEFYPKYSVATHLIQNQIESAIDHAFCKDEESANEIRMQLSIRGWNNDTKQFILDALKFYREAHIESLKNNKKDMKQKQFVKNFVSIYISDESIEDQINAYLLEHENFRINNIINLNCKYNCVMVIFGVLYE